MLRSSIRLCAPVTNTVLLRVVAPRAAASKSTSTASAPPQSALPPPLPPPASTPSAAPPRQRPVAASASSAAASSSSPSSPFDASSFDAAALSPAQVIALATGGSGAEARRALLREAVADAAGALHSTLLTDEAAAARVLPPQRLASLERSIGYSFPGDHAWLLRAALVHKSYRAEAGRYAAADVLSWHGDAVLYALLAEAMVSAYPSAGVADLTAARIGRISRESLSELARAAGMDGLVLVGKSFAGLGGGGLSRGMLGEAFEALLGAVACSGGMDAARDSYFKMAPLPAKLRTLMAETMRSSTFKG